jgi:hypothetical protein
MKESKISETLNRIEMRLSEMDEKIDYLNRRRFVRFLFSREFMKSLSILALMAFIILCISHTNFNF